MATIIGVGLEGTRSSEIDGTRKRNESRSYTENAVPRPSARAVEIIHTPASHSIELRPHIRRVAMSSVPLQLLIHEVTVDLHVVVAASEAGLPRNRPGSLCVGQRETAGDS